MRILSTSLSYLPPRGPHKEEIARSWRHTSETAQFYSQAETHYNGNRVTKASSFVWQKQYFVIRSRTGPSRFGRHTDHSKINDQQKSILFLKLPDIFPPLYPTRMNFRKCQTSERVKSKNLFSCVQLQALSLHFIFQHLLSDLAAVVLSPWTDLALGSVAVGG